MVPYERNHFFVGRNSFLKKLNDKLALNNSTTQYHGRVALFGLGGIGKTQVALAFVYRSRITYSRIYWMSGATQEALLDGYAEIARRAEIRILPDSKPIAVAEQVISWLNRTQNWLLVIDNLDNINVLSTHNLGGQNIISTLLPQSGPGHHTLITTRNPSAEHIPAQGEEVPLFDECESIDLLSSLSDIPLPPNSPETKFALQIVKELGHLPLAISQAGAYIKRVSGTFSEFIESYSKDRARINAWIPNGPRPYPHSVATTWIMSFNEIRKNNPTAAELFQLLAFLNPDGILIEFLRSGAPEMDGDLRRLLSDEFEFKSVLLEFDNLSLLKWDRQRGSILLHRLVQAVVKDEMSDQSLIYFRTMINAISNRAFPTVWGDLKDRLRCRRYVGQVIGPLLDPKLLESETSIHVLHFVGWFLRDDGKSNDSETLSRRSFEISERLLGDEHATTLSTKDSLASTYWAQGKIAEASKLEEEVLEQRVRILGEEHPDTLSTKHNLAETYKAQGKIAEASKLEEEVLEQRVRILGEEHPDTLSTKHNLAETYWAQGKIAEASKLQEEVLEQTVRILGEEHPDTLSTKHNLASTYKAQGKIAEAGKLQEEVLEQRVRILGEEHPDTLSTKHSLASTYWAQGKIAEAGKLEEGVLEQRVRILGEEHPDTLDTKHNLVFSYRSQGKMAAAERLENEVRASIQRGKGSIAVRQIYGYS